MAVGIFDSGLGGLTVFSAVEKKMPDQSFVYLGDNLNAPYGVRDASNVFDLTTKCIERLWDEGCDLVVLACNTASAAALKKIQEEWVPKNKRVLGVFVPLIESLTNRSWGDNSPPKEVKIQNVALFATPSTVASRAFQRELAYRAIGVDVESQACGGLVDAIEDGDLILADALVRSHVEALKRKMPNPQAAILGCTHYPLLENIFKEALGPSVEVFSQANLVAASLSDYLLRHPEMVGEIKAKNVFITDGSCMTSSSCVNPSITYMALTARAANYALSELKKRNL